jgi:predicted esterase
MKATAAYQDMDYETAARYYIAFLRARPGDASALYNLSCCYGLLGSETFAADALLLAYKAGFEDLGHIDRDPDFDKVRDLSYFSATRDTIESLAKAKAKAEGKVGSYPIGTWLPYRLYYPDGYDPSQFYTLLVGLHGFGDTALNYGYMHRVFKDRPVVFLVPEAPYQLTSMKTPGYSWSPMVDEEDPLQEDSFLKLEEALLNLVAKVKEDIWVDKAWLFGFSQGCAFSYMVGLRNPEVFDGILAFGGWLDDRVLTDEVLEAANNTRVFIGHGTSDTVIDHKSADEALARLEQLHFPVRLYNYEGSHRIDKEALLEGLTWLEGK